MSTLSFAVDVVARGGVLGADHTSSPDDVDRILGVTSAETRPRRQLWRDYGLVDFFWERQTGEPAWRGTHFTVQIHRLRSAGTTIAADPIQIKHGPLQPSLPFETLRTALSDLDIDLIELPSTNTGVREFWQPESAVHILVSDDPHGEVHAITAPLRAEYTVSWWLRLFLQIEAAIRDRSHQRTDAVRLYLWTVHHAYDSNILNPAETAIRISSLRSTLRYQERLDEVADIIPTPEQIVRACLNALPITLDQAQTPCRLHPDNIEAMRTTRQAKNLINAATPHLADLQDAELHDQLSRWISAKSNLA